MRISIQLVYPIVFDGVILGIDCSVQQLQSWNHNSSLGQKENQICKVDSKYSVPLLS